MTIFDQLRQFDSPTIFNAVDKYINKYITYIIKYIVYVYIYI